MHIGWQCSLLFKVESTVEAMKTLNPRALSWMVALAMNLSLFTMGDSDPARAEELTGDWLITVDLDDFPQSARLELRDGQAGASAKLIGPNGSMQIDETKLDGKNCLLNYSMEVGYGLHPVQLSLQLEGNTLQGTASTGEGELRRSWPVRAARVGSAAETVLRRADAKQREAWSANDSALRVQDADELLGAWELLVKSALAKDAPTTSWGMLIMDVDGKIVVGVKGERGPQRSIYDAQQLNGVLRFTFPIRFAGLVTCQMQVRRQGDELLVELISRDDGTLLLTGKALRKESGEDVGIDPKLLTQQPSVELIGMIGDNARVVHIRGDEVCIQQGTHLASFLISHPLRLPVKWSRVPEKCRILSLSDSIAHGQQGGELLAFDVSGSVARPVAGCDVPGNTIGDSTVSGSLIFGENWNGRADTQQIQIIDISNPSTPLLLSSIDTPKGASNYDLVRSDDILYIANAGGLKLVDVSDPTEAVMLSTFKGRGRWVRGVAVSNSMAYIMTSIHDQASWFQLVNVSDPRAPVQAGLYQLEGSARDVAVLDSYAYVTDSFGLHVIDVADPTDPQHRGSFRIHGNLRRVTRAGKFILVEYDVVRADVVGNREQLRGVALFQAAG